MVFQHRNRVEERRCPACGAVRPFDWFLQHERGGLCWKCRELPGPRRKSDIPAQPEPRVR